MFNQGYSMFSANSSNSGNQNTQQKPQSAQSNPMDKPQSLPSSFSNAQQAQQQTLFGTNSNAHVAQQQSLFGNSNAMNSNANVAQQQASGIFGAYNNNAQPQSFSNAQQAQQQSLFGSNSNAVNNNLFISQQQPGIFAGLNNAQQQQQYQQQIFSAPVQNNLYVPNQNFGNYQAPIQQQQQNYGYMGGIFGFPQNPNVQYPEPNQLYNDDEPLIEKAKQEEKDAKIQLQMRAQRSLVKLKTKTQLPAMITLKATGGSRTSVDLICVIDNSGSMSGQKIQLVKSTVKFLLQTLTPADRLSIITFNSQAQRLCGLKCVTGQNMSTFTNIVDNISAGGGTTINSGLTLALKTIRERKHINKVASIFLLSDGQDKGAEQTFKNSLAAEKNKELGVFSLHSFGFGSDHDEQLMNKLCQLKDGAFYYIKELSTLDQAFCNALGGIISVVANQVIIKLSNISKNIVQGIKIKKVYGKMWQKLNDKQYKIKISQLMSGVTKDFVFQLQIPQINTEVGDLDRDHVVLQSIFTAKTISNKNMDGQCCLQLTLLNQNQNIPDTVQNVQVIQNYLRVKAAEAIQQNLKKADQQQYAQAQKGIDTMIKNIQNNPKARKQKMSALLTDLNQIKQKCQPQQYAEARKVMYSAQNSHAAQNNFAYSNCVQTTMVQQLQQMKPQQMQQMNSKKP